MNIGSRQWLFLSVLTAVFMSIAYFFHWILRDPTGPFVRKMDGWMARKCQQTEPEIAPLSSVVLQERLSIAKLKDQFDKEVHRKNFRGMIQLMKKAGISSRAAEMTVFAILNKPQEYDYKA